MVLNSQQINNYRNIISKIARTACIVNANGIFEIYNVSESDAERIVRLLQREKYIRAVNKVAGRYNFNKFNFSKGYAEPSRYFTVRGILKEEALNETVEIHQELNPKIWDADQELIPEVRQKILEIVNTFKSLLLLDNVDLKVEDIYILGSNANYNYNEDSDLDVHIIADESFDCSDEHLAIIYNCYKTLFNNKYDINIKGINVELYVENKDKLSNVSNGVYSLQKGWIKNPSKYDMPEIDQVKIDRQVQIWEDKYYNIIENPSVKKIDDYIDALYEIRKKSIQEEGEFGEGNLVFKEIRRLGYLNDLKDLKIELTSKELSLEALEEAASEKRRYHYKGPVFHFDDVLTRNWENWTEAVSDKQALNNLTVKAKNHYGYDLNTRVTLDPYYLEIVEEEEDFDDEILPVKKVCPKCGRELNDNDECILCDLGDETVLEEKKLNEQKLPYYVLAWKLFEVIAAMNNEEAYYGDWLYIWPDGETKQDCKQDFNDKESYEELKKTFTRIYKEYHDDGLYTDLEEIVDYAHEIDKKLGLEPIENLKEIK